jgi:hypothetical protein
MLGAAEKAWHDGRDAKHEWGARMQERGRIQRDEGQTR